jgi:CheY-like chemotaxis protein
MPCVLVVEDEIQIAELVRELLEEEQYAVRLAGNGRAALEVLATVQVDLILSDVMMPFMTGIELCRTLSTHATYHTIPVILISAGADVVSGSTCPHVAFLSKPFNIAELLEVVARHAPGSNPDT